MLEQDCSKVEGGGKLLKGPDVMKMKVVLQHWNSFRAPLVSTVLIVLPDSDSWSVPIPRHMGGVYLACQNTWRRHWRTAEAAVTLRPCGGHHCQVHNLSFMGPRQRSQDQCEVLH